MLGATVMKTQTFLTRIVPLLIVSHLLAGCGEDLKFKPGQFGANGSDDPNNNHTETTIRSFKPALAVRANSCVMCHAKIDGNMITDFGYGDPYFMSGNVNSN